jgi:integrase
MRCTPGRQETLFWDASCRGFGLRALASGRRTWVYQYRDEHKRTRRIALGDASAVSLDAAKQAARRHAASVTQGANPSADRQSKKNAVSVLSATRSYLSYAKRKQRPRSYQETERHLLKHASPLHHERMETVRRSTITTLLDGVTRTSGPVAANRLRAALSSLWSWSIRTGFIETDNNPVSFTPRHSEQTRDRTLSDAELRAIWASTAGDGDYDRIVRLCLLTGCRRDEIGGLRWSEVLADRVVIGRDRMKVGTAHEVPLLPAIAAALPNKPYICGPAVFGRKKTGFSGWSKSKVSLDAKLSASGNTIAGWTLHDIRRTFSTRLHDAGVAPIVIESLLAHKQQGVAAVYNRASFHNAKRDALSLWHSILAQITA